MVHAPKGQKAHSPGQRPGTKATRVIRPERAKALISYIMLLPLQGANPLVIIPQGDALGYEQAAPSGRLK